jgi:hypothetical protein
VAGRVALATSGILVQLIVAAIAGSRIGSRALALVSWCMPGLLALGVALSIGGAAYPFLRPAFGVATAGWIETLVRKGPTRSLHVTASARRGR